MIRTLVVGLGNMGRSHALAYHNDPAFEIVGLVNRSTPDLTEALAGYPLASDYDATCVYSSISERYMRIFVYK
jgi:predicted dehydrogenase